MKSKIDPDMPCFPQVMAAKETVDGIKYPKAVTCYSTFLSVVALFTYGGIDFLRDTTRPFYNAIGSVVSGWSSLEVVDLKEYNSYLKPKVKKKSVCNDHWAIPQPFSNFMLIYWRRFVVWEEFFKAWKMCSKTIKVTKIQNDAFSMFTFKSDDGIVNNKVSVLNHERYEILNVKCTKDVVGTSQRFPHEDLTSECPEIFNDWTKFQEEYMLDSSLLDKVSLAQIQDKVEEEREEIEYVIENFGH